MIQHKSIEDIVREQVQKWEMKKRTKVVEPSGPVITLSRLPGCGARKVVQKLSEVTGFDIYNENIIEKVAEDSHLSKECVKSLDEKGMSLMEEQFKSLVSTCYISTDDFMKHLTHVVMTVVRHGRAIIYGRGASQIVPHKASVRVLLVAPLEVRIKNVVREYKVGADTAKRHIMQTESERKAYIRRYFHVDFTDPGNYDLVINTNDIDTDTAVRLIKDVWDSKHKTLTE
jgi:cytidylate kinase